MLKDNVVNPGDIAAAAAQHKANLAAPTEEPATAPPAETTTPEPELPAGDPAAEESEGEGEPTAAGEPDGEPAEPAPPQDAKAQWDAEMKRREADLEAKTSEFEKMKSAAEESVRKLLEDPAEYERTRKQLGLDRARETSPAQPDRPAGPDPIEQAQLWKLSRILAYQRYFEQKPADERPTLDQLEDAAERDLANEQLRATNARTRALEQRLAERDRVDRDRVAAAQAKQQADAVQRELAPLIAKYPGLESDAEDIEAAVHYARSRGQKPDLAAIVKRFADRNAAVIKKYSDGKRKLAAGSAPARSAGGGQARAPGSVVSELPPTPESIMELARLGKTGQLK